MTPQTNVPEVLAPAGDWDCIRAAVANGADAVYFGLDQFNARHRAKNFSLDELPDVMAYLHRHNAKGFVTFNTLIFSDELEAAVDYVRAIAAAGVDAVIVQDLGVAKLIGEIAPTLHVHGSTQMTLTERRGIDFVRRLGVRRVVLARELSVDDIANVANTTNTELEVFVHGALCVAYSGQCLTSEALGGRSANRGQCAQACRLPYELVVDEATRDLGEVAYLLSPRDLAAHELVGRLAEIGVASLKIEGRLKSPQYVSATTQAYRAAVDTAARRVPFALDAQRQHDLELVYSRGLSHGFLGGVNHQALVHGRFPKSRGKRVGVVVDITPRGIVIESELPTPLKNGDGIVFDEGRPETEEIGGRVYGVTEMRHEGAGLRREGKILPLTSHASPLNPARFLIDLGRNGPRRGDVRVGAIVWHTDDPATNKRLTQSFATDRVVRRVKINASVRAFAGQPLEITLSDGVHEVTATSTVPVNVAGDWPATEQSARGQVEKLRDTPFELDAFAFATDGKSAVPAAVWAQTRRAAVEELIALREASATHVPVSKDVLARLRTDLRGEGVPPSRPSETPAPQAETFGCHDMSRPALHVMARTLEQVEALVAFDGAARPATIYCDFEDVRRHKAAVEIGRAAGVAIGIATIRVQKPGEEGWLKQLLDCGPDLVLVRSLAALEYFRDVAPMLPLVGDYSLNVANELTAGLLFESGLQRLVPSYDLNWRQMEAMLCRSNAQRFECVVHQHMPMFHMEHCVFAHMLSTGKDYRDCGRPCEKHQVDLRDRTGQRHPLIPDAGCRNTVYNATPQSAADYLARMQAAGVGHFRVELLREKPDDALTTVKHYAALLTGKAASSEASSRRLPVLSQLGVTRGTFERE